MYKMMNNLNTLITQSRKNFVPLRICKNFIFITMLVLSANSFAQKTYQKEYYDSGQLKEEGWVLATKRVKK